MKAKSSGKSKTLAARYKRAKMDVRKAESKKPKHKHTTTTRVYSAKTGRWGKRTKTRSVAI